MNTRDREIIIRDWLAIAEGPLPGEWTRSEEKLTRLIRTTPETAWDIVITLIDRASSREALSFLAASPLEDLLSAHGSGLIDRVERRANDNAKFREALQALRQLRMSDEVWARVQRAAYVPGA
jgi:hypothetical protein